MAKKVAPLSGGSHAPRGAGQIKFEQDCQKYDEWRLMAQLGIDLDRWLRVNKKYGDIRNPNVYFVGSPRSFHLTVEGKAHGEQFRKTIHGTVSRDTFSEITRDWDKHPWNVKKI